MFYRLSCWKGVVALTLMGLSVPAGACFAPPPPFDPAKEASDLVLIGRVTNRVKSGDRYRDAKIAVSRVAEGRFRGSTYRLDHKMFDGSGICARGPIPRRGDRLVIYLRSSSGRQPGLRGFLHLRDAAKVDPRIAGKGRR